MSASENDQNSMAFGLGSEFSEEAHPKRWWASILPSILATGVSGIRFVTSPIAQTLGADTLLLYSSTCRQYHMVISASVISYMSGCLYWCWVYDMRVGMPRNGLPNCLRSKDFDMQMRLSSQASYRASVLQGTAKCTRKSGTPQLSSSI